MSRILTVLGILFLAQLIFVGLVYLFLKVQGKDSRETFAELHSVPVLGGWFPAPPPAPPEVTEDEIREMMAKRSLNETKSFFKLPDGFSREELEKLVIEVGDARGRYQQGLLGIQGKEEEQKRLRVELETEREALMKLATSLDQKTDEIKAGWDELRLDRVRVDREETKNLKAIAVIYEQMSPQAAVVKLGDLAPELAAKILMQMNPRKSGKILAAMEKTKGVEITQQLKRLTLTSNAATTDTPSEEKASSGEGE